MRRPDWLLKFACLACLWALCACSPATLVNELTSRRDFSIQRDIPYAVGDRHQLDLYTPKDGAPHKPVVIFFYGGNWEQGSKTDYLFAAAALASRGFIVAIPDYRLYPEIRFPTFLQDAAQSVRWVEDHASTLGGDPNRIFLMGHSAGAYIAAMLALDPRWLGAVGIDPATRLRGVIGLAGPYDFLPLHSDTLRAIFGPARDLANTQPINFVDGRSPPMLLISGTDDDTVDPGNSARLAAAITAKGGRAATKFYPGIGHILLIGAFAFPLRSFAPVLTDSIAFMNRDSVVPSTTTLSRR